jgi:hypothetical protein
MGWAYCVLETPSTEIGRGQNLRDIVMILYSSKDELIQSTLTRNE